MAGRRPAPPGKSVRSGTPRLPWRSLGLGSSAIGGIAAAYHSCPPIGLAIISCGVAATMIIIGAALFGSATVSGRAFRFLRWLADRPEPAAPPAEVTRPVRRSNSGPDAGVIARRARAASPCRKRARQRRPA